MNDNIGSTGDTDGKLMRKEMGGETRSIDAGDVTAKKAAFAVAECNWAKFSRVGVVLFVESHEIVSRESFAKVGWELVCKDECVQISEEIPTGQGRMGGCGFSSNIKEKIGRISKKSGGFTPNTGGEGGGELIKMKQV
jgi:hypothetical protein